MSIEPPNSDVKITQAGLLKCPEGIALSHQPGTFECLHAPMCASVVKQQA